MKKLCAFTSLLFLCACTAQTSSNTTPNKTTETQPISVFDSLYSTSEAKSGTSQSLGSVSNGSLKNGRVLPYVGSNFFYFDSLSYISKRAFVHEKVRNTLLQTYNKLESELPGKVFGIMECSNENGGKIHPHRTHQNGLSVDFMTPILKNGSATSDLDHLGAEHYLFAFDDTGHYIPDTSYSIDFETLAHHLLVLEKISALNGLKINKVLFKIELKDELFSTPSGKLLVAKNVYFAQQLTPIINSLHDDHYHVDFELLP